MEENTTKFEIKIDPLDLHVGLKDKMAEFESLIRMESPGKKLKEKIEKDLKSRFCHCCFFGHVKGELMGEPLCEECARALYGFDENEEHPSIKKIDPYYQLWYRRRKALPIFEAYLHSEIERYKLEQKLEDEIAELKDKLREQTSIAEEGWKEFRTYHTSYAEAVKELYDKNKEIAELKEKLDTTEKLLNKALNGISNGNKHMMSLARKKNHSDYKRCLAMARECINGEIKLKRVKMRDMNDHQFWQFDNDYWLKWNKRWLKIAEQFKEAK